MNLVLDNNNYDEFLKTRFVSGNFLQSSFWQEFLNKQNLRSWRATVLDNDKIVATCLFYERKLLLSRSYLYAPRGPIISHQISADKQKEALELILSKARDITIATKKQEEIFFKVELEEQALILARMKKSRDIQPADNWVLDLDKDIKDLLGAMHPKTRYNIAVANKNGVKIRFSKNKEDLEHFFKLNQQTASRNQIVTHSENYYKKLFETLVEGQAGELAIAEKGDKVLAINILLYFGEATTYLHGASDYNERKYMAPQLLQWESIKKSKESGKKVYDFGGVAPLDGSRPKWDGFTRFKKSFGGRVLTYPGAYDLIYDSAWYNLYNLGFKLKYLLRK